MSEFMSQSMTREAALRIGLAARELAVSGVTELVTALAGKLLLPLTEEKLARLTVAELRDIASGSDQEELRRAVRVLRGEGVAGSELPTLEAYSQGDMPGSIRVACASNNAEQIDGHFGSCERFLIYQVAPSELRLIAGRPTLSADYEEDRNASRARLISDCQVVYVQSIGGPAAAKVVRVGVHPVKIPRPGSARDILIQLQETLTAPPPWLAKAMGVSAKSLEKFAEMTEE